MSLFLRLKDMYQAYNGSSHYANIAHEYNKQYTLQVSQCVCELLMDCTACICLTLAGLSCVTLELNQAQLHLS